MINYFIPLLLILNFQQSNFNDKSYSYHNKLADYYYHKGNYPEMMYHLLEKVKIDPKDVATWSDIGYYYWSMAVNNKLRENEFKNKALIYLNRGLKSNSETYFLWDDIGRFHLLKSKDYNSAIPFFEEATNKKDCKNITYHLLATCYEKNNRVNDAIKTLNECLKRFPNDAKAKSELDSFKD